MTPDRVPHDPFGPTADAATYVPRPATERVLDALSAWAVGEQPVALLTGPPGIGKTLLLRVLERRLEAVCRCVSLPYAALSARELCGWALGLLGEPAPTAGDPETALAASAERLARSGRPLLLVVDDASAMPADTIRRLRGMAEASGGALRVLAAGLELAPAEAGAAATQDPHGPDAWIRAFGKGTPHFRLAEPMSEEETWRYLRTRLETSVAPPELVARFDARASARLHAASGGIPRELHGLAGEFLRVGERALAGAREFARPAPAAPPVRAPEPGRAAEPATETTPPRTVEAPRSAEPAPVTAAEPPPMRAAEAVVEAPAAAPVAPDRSEPRPARAPEPEPPSVGAVAQTPAAPAVDAEWPAFETSEPAVEDETPLPVSRTAARARDEAPPRPAAPPVVASQLPIPPPDDAEQTSAGAATPIADAFEVPRPTAPLRPAAVSRPPVQRVERGPGRGELALVAAGLVALAVAVPFVLSVLGRSAPPTGAREPMGESSPPARTAPALEPASPEPVAPEPVASESAAPPPSAAPEPVAPEPVEPAQPVAVLPAIDVPSVPTGEPLPPRDLAVAAPAPVELEAAQAPPSEAATVSPESPPPAPVAEAAPAPSIPAPVAGALPEVAVPDVAASPSAPAPPTAEGPAEQAALPPAAPPPAAAAPEAAPAAPPVAPAPVAAAPPPAAAPAPEMPEAAAEPPAPAEVEGEPVRVNVNATPWAWVTVDGVDLGETPLSGVLLREGEHDFTARMPDGRVVRRKVQVDADNRFIGFE